MNQFNHYQQIKLLRMFKILKGVFLYFKQHYLVVLINIKKVKFCFKIL